MLDDVLVQVRGLVKTWQQEATQGRARSSINPVADTQVSCAEELDALLDLLDRDTELLSPEQYAGQFPPARRPSAQTVRNWIRSGRLAAEVDAKGHHRIRRDARVAPRQLRRAQTARRVT